MILLVCGGREFQEYPVVKQRLDPWKKKITVLVQGGARGADHLANSWAQCKGIHVAEVTALWGLYGKAAGHLRNQAMLALKPDYYVAFPGGRGTADMISRCEKAGIPELPLEPDDEL